MTKIDFGKYSVVSFPIKGDVKVRYRDLSVSDPVFRNELLRAVEDKLCSGELLMGSSVEKLEKIISEFCGSQYCVAVSSGTDAIYLALRAFNIGPGDEVIVPAMSWVATVNAVIMAGANPIFVDIRDDLNINSDLIIQSITKKTKAILPVHYTGRLCDIIHINEIAKKYNLVVIEDAAQSFGAQLQNSNACQISEAVAYSLNPMKIFPSFGEVGAILVNDEEVANHLRSLRYLGTINKEIWIEPSLNFKVDEIQAAMMLVSFSRVASSIERRLEIAKSYGDSLGRYVECPTSPTSPNDKRSVFFDYTIITEKRDDLGRYLADRGIEIKIRHPLLLTQHPCMSDYTRIMPNAELLVDKILSLPIHEKLTDAQVDYIIEHIKSFFEN